MLIPEGTDIYQFWIYVIGTRPKYDRLLFDYTNQNVALMLKIKHSARYCQ